MDFSDSHEEAAFRVEVRDWLARNAAEYAAPPKMPWPDEERIARGKAWQHTKADAGYACLLWPKWLGGREATQMEAVIFAQEEDRYFYPYSAATRIGQNQALPTIINHGTREQAMRFAERTRCGEWTWCQLFSEPHAGSDVASARTRAVREGDHWIVNGQKTWTSEAQFVDWGILVARTDPDAPKHKGLTFFVVDMKSPGIDIRPIDQINGEENFCEVFFKDVVVPDENRIGDEGEGWACIITTLGREKSIHGGNLQGYAGELLKRARKADDRDPGAGISSAAVREKIARFHVRELGLRYFQFRLLSAISSGHEPGPEVAVTKLVSASLLQQSRSMAMDLGGLDELFLDEDNPAERRELYQDYLWSGALRIAGGADEVLRNQISERVLGMPKK
jgi:Acyl-CoA dehydrogenases